MQYLKAKWNSGSVTMVNLVTWGIGLMTFASSLVYASYTATGNRVTDTEIKLAGQEATVAAMSGDLKEVKSDIKLLLQKVK